MAEQAAAPTVQVSTRTEPTVHRLPGTGTGFWSVGSSEARVKTIQGPPTDELEYSIGVVLFHAKRDRVLMDRETRRVEEWINASGAVRVRAVRVGKMVGRIAGTSSLLSVEWLDVGFLQKTREHRLPPRIHFTDHSPWIEELLQRVGLEYQKGNTTIRIFGYSLKCLDLFEV